MQTLPSEFSAALTRIQVDSKAAIEAQTEVRGVLEMSERLRQWGVDTILIGSYGRDTGIRPGKDVDIFAKLTKLDASSTTQSNGSSPAAAASSVSVARPTWNRSGATPTTSPKADPSATRWGPGNS